MIIYNNKFFFNFFKIEFLNVLLGYCSSYIMMSEANNIDSSAFLLEGERYEIAKVYWQGVFIDEARFRKKVLKFLGEPVTEDELEQICDELRESYS